MLVACADRSRPRAQYGSRSDRYALIAALGEKKHVEMREVSVSYMLAGEGEALGVNNTDPFATKPTADDDWVKEGPHLMVLVPDATGHDNFSTNPTDPVYVMWKGTPYANIIVEVGAEGTADMPHASH